MIVYVPYTAVYDDVSALFGVYASLEGAACALLDAEERGEYDEPLTFCSAPGDSWWEAVDPTDTDRKEFIIETFEVRE